MKREYCIIDPAGNVTALVTTPAEHKDYKSVAARIMSGNPQVEQVGFVEFGENGARLNMSGDEFCGNAVMCAAALYCSVKGGEKGVIPVTVLPFGKTLNVTVCSKAGDFICECEFSKPQTVSDCSFFASEREYRFPLVCFDGIMHVVADNTLSEAAAKKVIIQLAKRLKAQALGIMLYDPADKSLLPVVYVPALNTLVLERSCASGSCAVAAVLPEFENAVQIAEPGGVITARRTKEGIYLKTRLKITKKLAEEI